MSQNFYFPESDETVEFELSTIIIAAAEPFTWAQVGVKLAEGVVTWAGGKIAEGLFFRETKVADLLDEAVRELKRFIKEELERREIDAIKADIRSATRILGEWINAPRTSGDRVTLAHEFSARSYERLAAKDLAVCTIFADAVSVHLYVLLARYYSFGDRGELRNIVALIDDAEKRLIARWIDPHIRSLERSRDSIHYVGVGMTPGRRGNSRVDDPGIPPSYFGRYSVSGMEHHTELRGDTSDERGRAEQDARKAVADLRAQTQKSIDEFSESIRNPIIGRIAEWKRAADVIRQKQRFMS